MATQSNHRDFSIILFGRHRSDATACALDSLTRQTLPGQRFEVLAPASLALPTDDTFPFAIQRYRTLNQAIDQCTGRFVLFLDSTSTLATTLLQTHLALHQSRPESKLSVLGSAHPSPDSIHNPLTKYLDEEGLLTPYQGWLPMGTVAAKDALLHNLSLPLDALTALGGFDPEFSHTDSVAVDLCFRLQDDGYTLLYNADAKTTCTVPTNLTQIAQDQFTLAQEWVTLFVKHPQRIREWGALRHANRIQLETQADELSEQAAERTEIIEQLAGFHFDNDPDNPVGNPETQRRILCTIDEQFTPLHKGWWSAGFAEGLYAHGLDGFETLLSQSGRTEDLFSQNHLIVADDTLHPLQQQALFDWSSSADEHTLGGMVIATTCTHEDQLDRLATQIASTVLRACPKTKPAAVHLVTTDHSSEALRSLFLATDKWIARPSPQARTWVTTAHEEGCAVQWLPDTGVMHAPNLPGNVRIGLWPDWEGYTDLLTLIDKWWPALSARQDCSIVLFHEKHKASRAKRSAQTLQELLDQSADGDHTAHVVTAKAPENAREQAYWRAHLDGVIQLASGYGSDRMNWLKQLDARPFFTPIELERHLVTLHLLTDQLLGHAPEAVPHASYQEVHEQLS